MKNSSNNRRFVCAATALSIAFAAGSASASLAFSDDFESGSLSNWTGKSFGGHDAFIVVDPLDHMNHAITFDTLEAGGEIFSADLIEFDGATSFIVSFDYLGFAKNGSVANNFGGYVGFSEGTPGAHTWMYGTGSVSGAAPDLIDDGVWRTYSFVVDEPTAFGGGATGFHLMFEDFSGSGGVAGDVLFDNINVRAIPAPGAGVLAMCGFACASRRRLREG